MKNQEQKNKEKKTFLIPELSKLSQLNDLAIKQEQDLLSNFSSSSFEPEIPNFLTDLRIDELEKLSNNFINYELIKLGFMDKINRANIEVSSLFDEIKFFSSNSAYLTGFFSSQFSESDNQKWNRIEIVIDSIYNSKTGYLKELQDYFLFQVDRSQLASLIDKTTISVEEELSIRSLLIKGYISNFRQLILPFHNVDDDFLFSFKRQRINQLEKEQKTVALDEQSTASLNNELALLRKQTEQVMDVQKINHDLQESSSLDRQKILDSNRKLNVGSIAIGTVETARYLTSFIGHSSNVDLLKTVGKFGAKTGSFLAKILPVVSVFAEAGTQMNNNRIIYNYEKQLKIIKVFDGLKRHLITLEQQVTDYYMNNVLTRLQEKMISNQYLTNELLKKANDKFSSVVKNGIDNKGKLQEKIEAVESEYQTNLSIVGQQIADAYEQKVHFYEEKICFYEEKTLEKQLILNAKEQEIKCKEDLLDELSKEVTQLKSKSLSLEKENVDSEEELRIKDCQLQQYNLRLLTVNEDLDITKRNLKHEHKLLEIKNQSLKEMMEGNFHASLINELKYTQQQKDDCDLIISGLITSQNRLQEQLSNSGGDFSLEIDNLNCRKEELEALNQHLDKKWMDEKVNNEGLKKSNQRLTSESLQLREEISQLERELSQSKKQLIKTDHQLFSAGVENKWTDSLLQYSNQKAEEKWEMVNNSQCENGRLKVTHKLLTLDRDQVFRKLESREQTIRNLRLVSETDNLKLQKLEKSFQKQIKCEKELRQQIIQQQKSFFHYSWIRNNFMVSQENGFWSTVQFFCFLFFLIIIFVTGLKSWFFWINRKLFTRELTQQRKSTVSK